MSKKPDALTHILSLDTATGEPCACLHAHSRAYLARLGDDQRARSIGLMPMLVDLLLQGGGTWAELQLLVFSHGPGSFTGLRIAAATLAGINSGLHLPLLHVSSLAVTARQALSDGPLWVLEDARAGEAFVGCYQQGIPVIPDRCMQWQHIARTLEAGNYVCHAQAPVALPGWRRLPLSIDRAEALSLQTRAECPAQAGLRELPVYPVPNYMQLSQAERNAYAG